MDRTDFRVFLEPQQGATYDQQLAVAKAAEALGFSALFRSDHYLAMSGDGRPGPTDAWITLAGLARDTTTIRLGTLVTSATFRHPGPLAISVAQVDAMSAGRIEFGFGAGWFEAEHRAYAIPFPGLGERFDRLTEQLDIITGLWLTPPGHTFDYSGQHYTLAESPALPKPVQAPYPPIVIGGDSKRALRRTAELGDYWYPFIVPKMISDTARTANISNDEEMNEAIAYMNEHCDKIGRKDKPGLMMAGGFNLSGQWNAQEAIDLYAHHKELGSVLSGCSIDASSVEEWCDHARRFGEEVIAKL